MAIRDTPNGYNISAVKSALQKSIRRGLEYDAFWWAHELGLNNQMIYVWRRLLIIACEDIGMGNPAAVAIVRACRDTWGEVNGDARCDEWEWSILAHAIIVLCRSPKSRSADDLSHLVWLRKNGIDPKTLVPGVFEPERLPIPDYALDMHTYHGIKQLSAKARKSGSNVDSDAVKLFSQVGAKSRNTVKDVSLRGENWTEELYKLRGLDPRIAFDPPED